ncbi:DUF983 domain-containing protein [Psychroflexus sp. YR1-1]|uniref:DUF983 domain-containing protein n=1 Tax=Psychroflexus aurantiacus TaxID=2709310 RepID=A0A6B3RBE6_9FLAO|nr:DUF983 domain-containing protein [Psychroflexus aurantiacus]NEV94834.1 DUF983 domain-containing protein [Psychroflexus aurantiacus]
MLKGTKLYSVFTGKCPVCHEGKMYKEPNPYKLSKIYEMHERCSVCNTKFKIEPSFFYGAMYISYGLGVAFAIASFLTSYFLIGLEVVPSFISIIVVLVLLGPIIMRLSRNIWINLFLSYDKDAKHKTSKTD